MVLTANPEDGKFERVPLTIEPTPVDVKERVIRTNRYVFLRVYSFCSPSRGRKSRLQCKTLKNNSQTIAESASFRPFSNIIFQDDCRRRFRSDSKTIAELGFNFLRPVWSLKTRAMMIV